MGRKITRTFTFVNSISVIFCCIVDDKHSGKTKVNCLKYIVKNVPISSHLTFFSILGLDFRHQNLDPWKAEFSFNKKSL